MVDKRLNDGHDDGRGNGQDYPFFLHNWIYNFILRQIQPLYFPYF